ncbi:MAG: hypothetical protein HXM38_03050 [Isoptericola variabilis]|nr:hypothetical protein [Isoptericola variabilis]
MQRQKTVPQFGVPGAVPGGGPNRGTAGELFAAYRAMEPKRRKKVKIFLGIVALFALSFALTPFVWVIERVEGTPDGEVRRYLSYLAEGDAAGALAMVDPGIPNEQRLFLTNEVLTAASSRIVVESVSKPTYSTGGINTKEVTATLRLNGDRFTHTFSVERRSKEEGDSSVWKIRDGLFVKVPVSGVRVPSFSVGSVSARVGSPDAAPVEYLFFPGVYTFQPEGLGPYVNAPATQVVVENGAHASTYETTSVSLDGQLTSALRNDVLSAVQKKVEDCATVGKNMHPSCPSELRTSAVTAIELLNVPQVLTSATEDGIYEAEDAVFRYQDGSSHDLTVRVEAAVVMGADGVPEVDIDGKPNVTVTMRKR